VFIVLVIWHYGEALNGQVYQVLQVAAKELVPGEDGREVPLEAFHTGKHQEVVVVG